MSERVTENKRAYHEYTILETYEAGIALKGSEVKSLRGNKASLAGSFAKVENGEVFLYHMHISSYEEGSVFNPSPLRRRKLLLKEQEIKRLWGKLSQKGLTLIPLKVYFLKGWAKILLGIAQRKKFKDKREELKRESIEKDMRKAKKNR